MRRKRILSLLLAGSALALASGLSLVTAPMANAQATTTPTWSVASIPTTNLQPPPTSPPSFDIYTTSCSSATYCMAVGNYQASNGSNGLVDIFQNGSWTASTFPSLTLPDMNATPDIVVIGDSCITTGHCVVVGEYRDLASTLLGFVGSFTNGTWSVQAMPFTNFPVGTQGAVPSTISCSTMTNCTLAGWYQLNSGDFGFGAVLSNGTWTVTALPISSLSIGQHGLGMIPTSMSCPSSTTCFVSGLAESDSLELYGWVANLSGGVWTTTVLNDPQSPAPQFNTPLIYPTSISCPTITTCYLTGSYQDMTSSPNEPKGFFDTWTSGTWSAETLPQSQLTPAIYVASGSQQYSLGGIQPEGLSCRSLGTCEFFGFYATSATATSYFSGQFSNGTLATQSVAMNSLSPTFQNGVGNFLIGTISCPDDNICFTAGAYGAQGGAQLGFIATLYLVPFAPSNVKATSTKSSVTISWSPAANATNYRVSLSPGNKHCLTTTAITCRISGLRTSTTYTVSVTASSASGTSPPATLSVSTKAPSASPSTTTTTTSLANTGSPERGNLLLAGLMTSMGTAALVVRRRRHHRMRGTSFSSALTQKH